MSKNERITVTMLFGIVATIISGMVFDSGWSAIGVALAVVAGILFLAAALDWTYGK